MSKKMEIFIFFYANFFLTMIFSRVIADPVEDKQALLDFSQKIIHSHLLNWNESTSLCKEWTGVHCNHDQSRVIAVRLPGIGFQGTFPINTLSRLSELQILSLRLNNISGPFPSDFFMLKKLKSISLQYNKFSGPLPSAFSVWNNLTVIDLSNNAFNGTIPSSISNLTRLSSLNLANNSLSGEIPDINIPGLQHLDLSNNNLIGHVPKSLQRFPSWVFSGNNVTLLQPPSSKLAKKGRRLGESTILGIGLGGCVIGFAVIASLMIFFCLKPNGSENADSEKLTNREVFLKKRVCESQEKNNNSLKFIGDCTSFVFDLEDLLRASAEILGKGMFGMTYKAALEDGNTVVVKRLKEVTVPRREFEEKMEVIGNIKHENVGPPRGYYYSKDEKLIVYEYYEQGSVSAMLHDCKRKGYSPLDWETRVRIATGAAKGIAHIHSEDVGKLVHGNIKASNIFLNSKGYGCVSDLGTTLTNPMPSQATRAAGYRAPEVLKDMKKLSEASDIYSFGVFILELLTGKSPIIAKGGDEGVNLVRWVNYVVREEWTAEVFDSMLLRDPNREDEMMEMLQIGLSCVARSPEHRPKMVDVVARIEQVGGVYGNELVSENVLEDISASPPCVSVVEIGSTSNSH